jgi:hypothetical protein
MRVLLTNRAKIVPRMFRIMAARPVNGPKRRNGSRTHADVITVPSHTKTVPSHTKKDNPKAALKPHPRRQ